MPSWPSRTSPTRAVRADPGRFSRAGSSERPARDPFAQQRVDDDVPWPFLEEHVLLRQRSQRRLDTGGAAQPMARSRIGRVQLTTILEDDRAKRRTLLQ